MKISFCSFLNVLNTENKIKLPHHQKSKDFLATSNKPPASSPRLQNLKRQKLEISVAGDNLQEVCDNLKI